MLQETTPTSNRNEIILVKLKSKKNLKSNFTDFRNGKSKTIIKKRPRNLKRYFCILYVLLRGRNEEMDNRSKLITEFPRVNADLECFNCVICYYHIGHTLPKE